MPIQIPAGVRQLLEAPNYVHLSTLRPDGSPRNWVVWVGLEGDQILICTSETVWKAKDMRRNPRVALSVSGFVHNPRSRRRRARHASPCRLGESATQRTRRSR